MKLSFNARGNLPKTTRFLASMARGDIFKALSYYGALGVAALSSATPKDTGLASSMWDYEISSTGNDVSITWLNYNLEGGVNVIILLQYGHGTGTGGYVAGRDFINPAIQPIFDKIADDVWKGVVNA